MERKYKAQPEKLPKPTYWPFFLALSCMLIVWGFVSNVIVSVVGVVVFIIALAGWITDLHKEQLKKGKEHEL